MSGFKFYWLNSPTVIEDSRKIAGRPLEDQLSYLTDRLKSIEYLSFKKDDPMKSPDVMFATGNGDCEDRVAYVASVLCRVGVPNTIYVGYVKEDGKLVGHVWLKVGKYLFETTDPGVFIANDVTTKYVPEEFFFCNRKGVVEHG